MLDEETQITQNLKQFEIEFQDHDIQKIIKERESYKKDYVDEMKKSKSIKSVLESQKRLLSTTATQFKISSNKSLFGLGSRPFSMGGLK